MALQDFSRSLPMLLYRALDAVMPRFRAIFNAHGITEQQWRVLRVVADEPGIAVSDLAAWTSIAAPSLVGVLDRLERANLVLRQRDTQDRRTVHIELTEAGRRLQQALVPQVAETYSGLMQSLPPREWVQLVASLEQIAGVSSNGAVKRLHKHQEKRE